jgi:uncharacterized protein (TIGR00251 family)
LAACEIPVRVIPRAARSGVAGARAGAILIRVAAPPADGAANTLLVDVLARALDLPRRHVSIVSGASSRTKRVRIEGLDQPAVEARLGWSVSTSDATTPTPAARRRSARNA